VFYCFLRTVEEPNRALYVYGIYGFGALAVLTKGLIGAALPGIVILVYLLITGQIRKLLQFRLFTGTLLFLAIAAPWHIAAGLANPGRLMTGTPNPSQGRGFFWFYFMNEHFLRYIGKRYPADYDTVPLPLFLALHIVWLFPWSFFLPLAVNHIPRRLRELSHEQRVVVFLVVWATLIVLFFSFSTTQDHYTMPAYPALALLVGYGGWKGEGAKVRDRRLRLAHVAIALVGLLVLAAGLFALWSTRGVAVEGDISATLTNNPGEYALSLGHVLDLTPRSIAA